MQKSKHTMDMCTGSILGKMLLFALPLMASGILQLLFNAADVIVVGRFAGKESLAAVGATTALINLLTNLFIGLSVGTNVLVARYFGADEEREVHDTVHTSMIISAAGGLILTLIGVTLAQPILTLMGTPDDVIHLSTVYLRTYFLGMTATMVYNFGAAILRAVGDTFRPLLILMVAGAVNVSLNLLFVIALHWGVFGVGMATAISQTVSAMAVVGCLLLEKGALKLSICELRISKDKLRKIVRIGLPAGLQGSMFSIANVVIQSSVNSFGSVVMAGNTAAQNLEGFIFVGMNAFHQSAISFTGQNVGAGRYERVNRILRTALACVVATAVTLSLVLVLFGEPLLGLYTSEPSVVAAGMARLRIMAISFALAGVMDVLVGTLRGLGYSVMPMIVSLVGVCALRLIWIFTVFQQEAFHTIDMLYITYPISWGLTIAAHAVCFLIVRRKLKRQWGV